MDALLFPTYELELLWHYHLDLQYPHCHSGSQSHAAYQGCAEGSYLQRCYSVTVVQLPFSAFIVWYNEHQVTLSKLLQSESNQITPALLPFQGWAVNVSTCTEILLTAVQSSPLGIPQGTFWTSRLPQVVIIGPFRLLSSQSYDASLWCRSH